MKKIEKNDFSLKTQLATAEKMILIKKNQENRQKRPFMPDILGTCMVLIAEMIISNCREDIE